MLRDGHLGIGFLFAAPVAGVSILTGNIAIGILMTLTILFGSGLPDLDATVSYFTHRGLLHTFWFGLIVSGVCMLAAFGAITGLVATNEIIQQAIALQSQSPVVLSIAAGLGAGIGVVSHLVGDMITPWGITPFAPVSERTLRVKLTTASNTTANTILLAGGCSLFVVSVFVSGYLFAT